MTAATGLNVFQRLVRTWEMVHPYNAAQVLTVDSVVGPDTAQSAWESVLAGLGLGRVRIDGGALCHEVLNGESSNYPVRVLPKTTDLAAYLTAELNRPFDDPDEPPYRPFMINEQGSSRLGVIYRHWVADSVSIRRVMQGWCERVFSQDGADGDSLSAAPGYWELFGARRAGLRIDQTALDLFRSHMRFRRVQKVRSIDGNNYSVGIILADPPDCLEGLRAHARRQSVTVGEVFLAALCEACSKHVPLQARPRRKDVAVGNIVDLRPHGGRDLSNSFGLLLGFTHVCCRPGDLRDWDRLLRVVSQQARCRRASVAQSSGAWMLAALAMQRLVRPEAMYRFYRKEIPLAAGLSNVNLNGCWSGKPNLAPVSGYLRISPTGPMAPVVLSVTTLGTKLQLALTYRAQILSEPQAQQMLSSIVKRLVML